MATTYDDLRVEIQAKTGEGHPVRAALEIGRADGIFQRPYGPEQTAFIGLRAGTGGADDGRALHDLSDRGRRLFDALFTGRVRDLYHFARGRALGRAHLRIKLNFHLAPELYPLPWELLHDDDGFLGLDRKVSVARFVEPIWDRERPGLTDRLSVLGVISDPGGTLDVTRERENVDKAVMGSSNSGNVAISWLEHASIEELSDRLRSNQVDVLHFIGHGIYDPATQDGALELHGERGGVKRLSSQRLATLVRAHPSLRLVVLTACESARGGEISPFGAIGSALAHGGVPAVIGMQHKISDHAAVKFTRHFYEALLEDGYPIDAAVAEARRQLYAMEDFEWATPVLFLGVDDGRLFDVRPSLPVLADISGPIDDESSVTNGHGRALPVAGGTVLGEYHRSVDARHPDRTPRAQRLLGHLHRDACRYREARAAYEEAIASGHHEEGPKAARSLGIMLRQIGKPEAARDAYQKAIRSGHPNEAPLAEYNVGNLLCERNDVNGAKEAYERAVGSSHVDAAPRAWRGLGFLYWQTDLPRARHAFEQAIATGHPDAAPRSARDLGRLLRDSGQFEAARAAFENAMASGHIEEAPKAARALGVMLRKHGQVEAARRALEHAIASDHRDEAPLAAWNLGNLLADRDAAGARRAYMKAIESKHPDACPRAARQLGLLLRRIGDVSGAEEAYGMAIESGHGEEFPKAANNLGNLLRHAGRIDAARAAYQQALDSGHALEAPKANRSLSKLMQT